MDKFLCPQYGSPYQRMLNFRPYKRISGLHDRITKFQDLRYKWSDRRFDFHPLPSSIKLSISWFESGGQQKSELKAGSRGTMRGKRALGSTEYLAANSCNPLHVPQNERLSRHGSVLHTKYHGRQHQSMLGHGIDLHITTTTSHPHG